MSTPSPIAAPATSPDRRTLRRRIGRRRPSGVTSATAAGLSASQRSAARPMATSGTNATSRNSPMPIERHSLGAATRSASGAAVVTACSADEDLGHVGLGGLDGVRHDHEVDVHALHRGRQPAGRGALAGAQAQLDPVGRAQRLLGLGLQQVVDEGLCLGGVRAAGHHATVFGITSVRGAGGVSRYTMSGPGRPRDGVVGIVGVGQALRELVRAHLVA